MSNLPLSEGIIADDNKQRLDALKDDYDYLARRVSRAGADIDALKAKAAAFSVAVPSWGVGKGGTRFAKFPIPGEPTNIHEKLEDCAVVNQLCRITPRVSPHFPWDKVSDFSALKEEAEGFGLGFDAVNSNTFQDQPGQEHSYQTGSLSANSKDVRRQAIEHNLECIEIGKQIGSRELTVWVGDGTNFPGQQDLFRSFERYLEAASEIYAGLPNGWRMLIEHKLFEPAFYSTVISDWGSSLLAAQKLGPKAQCLVDLGHHAPNVNIEQIVARLRFAGKLGGFHFNDSKYGDDDLDSGAINPHQLYLIFNELVEAEAQGGEAFRPAYMIDQSHNVTDPIESLLQSAEAIAAAYIKASIVDRAKLRAAQEENDVIAAFQILREAYNIDVSPVLAMARYEKGGAIDVLGVYRKSGWRREKAKSRRPVGLGAGIV